jgi:NADP-dependent 3-hydroxy acid dehydrogenase YdfG
VLSLVDINIASLRSLSSEITVSYPHVDVLIQRVDVTDESSIDTAVRKTVHEFGKIDIAVHAAGIGDSAHPTHNLSLDLWQNMVNINQTGLWLCERAIIRQMLQQK